MRRQVLSILVENESGVLSHISGLFSRRGYNIDSISAGVTADPRFTRITIVTSGDELLLEQIKKQVAKLEDVIDVKILHNSSSVVYELMLVKIAAERKSSRTPMVSFKELVDSFNGKIVNQNRDCFVVRIVGNTDKLDDFIAMLDDYEILELARTGLTGLSRGVEDVLFID
ncbi:MAG: acetolactate synthase small subunit [Lachnospiraceae bacterium]|nr:acetolactate synthase small subunit [Lachnospiraceae bacterium]